MPKENQEGQEKTEQPTARRLRQSRRKGSVAKSQELNSIAVLAAGTFTLAIFGNWIYGRLTGMMRGVFLRLDEITLDLQNMQGYLTGTAAWLLTTLLPLFVVVVAVGVLINLSQFGFLWSTQAVQPKLDKLNPFKGWKKLFNQRAAVRLLTNLVKILVVGYVAFSVVKRAWPGFVPLMDATVPQIFLVLMRTIFRVALWTYGVLLIVAILDFIFQKWKFKEDMKMTKQEVKDERKQTEGDPQIKGKIRQMQFQIAFNTMIKELPNADVVVTNPVHVAVALSYDPGAMSAPKVVGKGLRKLADRIKKIALENDIPIVENPPLARAMYKACGVGEEIPGQFYQDVAEILAQIYRLRGEEVPV